MARVYTVQDLIEGVRSLVDEANQDAVDDVTDILPSLNRAQLFAADILSKHYPDGMIVPISVPLVGGQADYDIPEDAFQDRLQKVEVAIAQQGDFTEVERISYRDLTHLSYRSPSAIPTSYAVIGRKYRLAPTPSGIHSLRVWYMREPDKYVVPQGRITKVVESGNYIIVDEAGPALSTESDKLQSYVNIVDGNTGIVKATLQINSITDGKIKFRTSILDRSSVYGRDIGTTLVGAALEPDDIVCSAEGTAVSQLRDPVNNFVIQYAVAEMGGSKLGGDPVVADRLLEKFEKQIQTTWSGREQQLRIKKKSGSWYRTARRTPFVRGS